MRILRRKSNVVLPVTEQDAKHSDKDESIKVISKSLTTLDFIGLVAENQGIDKIKKD